MALPGATFDVKWGADRVYSVGGKMFAVAGAEGDRDPGYSFKATDLAFHMLVEQGVARPAPYMARAMWVQLLSANALSDEELRAYLGQAHALTAAKLTRKARAQLGLA